MPRTTPKKNPAKKPLLDILDANEKDTMVNCIQFISQNIGVDRIDELNHLAVISKKIKSTMG